MNKFLRYRELCDLADDAMDRAIASKSSAAWRAAEVRNADAADYWRDECRECADAEMLSYYRGRHAEMLAWLRTGHA